MTLLEQTAPHVAAFGRNMMFGRFDAGMVNLAYINRLIDEAEASADGLAGGDDA